MTKAPDSIDIIKLNTQNEEVWHYQGRIITQDSSSLLVFGGITGVGIGLFITANWALLSRAAPLAQAGVYLGLTNLATAGSGAVGRLMGPLIDLLNNANPGIFWGYKSMFIFGALCSGLSALLLSKMKGDGTKVTVKPSHP